LRRDGFQKNPFRTKFLLAIPEKQKYTPATEADAALVTTARKGRMGL
jgi:hypothetical protein